MESKAILEGYSDLEKGAYLGAIASLATADREASQEELEYLDALSDSAGLNTSQKEMIRRSATELQGEELQKCLDVLKESELRFSLVTDLMAFAKSDENYTPEEATNIQKIAEYLGVNETQFSLLSQFTEKASASEVTPEEASSPSFLSSLGLQDKLNNAGMGGGFLKGLIGFAAPMILSGMLSRGLNRGRGTGGMLGGGGMFGGGGLGSLIGMLSGGRGMGSTGGLFGRIFGGGF